MNSVHPNRLIARLRSPMLDDLLAEARPIQLQPGQILADAGGQIANVYFPHAGTISNVVDLHAGKEIDTSLIGRDGVFGAGNALDDRVSINRVIVLVGGAASVLTTAQTIALAEAHDEFRKLVLAYEQFILGQAQQNAACNASHSVEARACRWLLRMHDLNGPDLNVTQEQMAHMLGVRRTSVTEVAGRLADEGAIRYSRGRLKILDVDRLGQKACECRDTILQAYAQLFPS